MFAANGAEGEQTHYWKELDQLPHIPVLAGETVDFLAGGDGSGLLVDGTAGAGGHLAMLVEKLPEMQFLAMERDPAAVSILRSRFSGHPSVTVRHGSYTEVPRVLKELGAGRASAALFDLGLSSIQLDDGERGFSFSSDGPLDRRFDTSRGETVSEMLSRMTEKEIADVIYRYGQEGRSRRIAAAIVRDRPIKSTGQLAAIVDGAVKSRGVKVLARVFQALRIAVNGELDELETMMEGLGNWTLPGSRIAFITFHSIEDRMVKLLFRDDPHYRQHDPKWVVPGEDEIQQNSRARSARLRMGFRI